MVFHQVDEMNKPVLDLSHVLTCLNKVGLSTCSIHIPDSVHRD